MDELLLIDRIRSGDQEAFRQLVETYQNLVYNTALGIVQNEADAEDVAQEVFLKVYQAIGGFKGNARLSTWLYRITVTRSLDFERRKKRKKRPGNFVSLNSLEEETGMEPPDFQHPGVVYDRKEEAALLFKAIRKLPENQRIAFTLHKVEGLSYAEVSEVMELSVSAVEALLHRARSNLKKTLGEILKNESNGKF